MKKFLAFILATVMLAAIAVPALADDAVVYTVCANGKHSFVLQGSDTDYDYYNNSYHRKVTVEYYKCSKCKTIDTERITHAGDLSHDGYYVSASCNGTTQTHVLYCPSCHSNYTKTISCPKATHSGDCHWLPI